MRITTTLLSATNRHSRYPVSLITAENGTQADARALANEAVHIQSALGAPRMRIIDTDAPGQAGFECLQPDLGRALMQAMRQLAKTLGDDAAFKQTTQDIITRLSHRWELALTHPAAQAAMRLGLPWQAMTRSNQPLITLGHGIHRRHFWVRFTPETAEIGVVFSTPKHVMAHMLAEAGLPVPKQSLAKDLATAQQLAEDIGWPVVVKPARTDRGIGITTGITSRNELASAFEIAAAHGAVLVQEHVEGSGYRLLVHNRKMIAAVRQMAARVVGDGRSTVSELIAQTNKTRTKQLSRVGTIIEIDDVAHTMLNRAGLSLDSIPELDQPVVLRGNTNLSQGGTLERVTDAVHPANRAIAEAAAAVFGLDLAGVDLHTEDISRPLRETGGAVIEVNASPGLMMMEEGTELEDQLFSYFCPAPDHGRIPIVVCIEDHPQMAQAVAASLSDDRTVARVTSHTVHLGDHKLATGDAKNHVRCLQIALSNPLSQAAVLSVPAEAVLRLGLGVDRVSVVVAAPASDLTALRVLDQSTDCMMLFAADLPEVHKDRQGNGDLWCLAPEPSNADLTDVTTVSPIGDGMLRVSPPSDAAKDVSPKGLSPDAPIALRVAAALGPPLGSNS